MTTAQLARLHAQLVRHEGLKLRPYRCPSGKLTIGVGRNLDDRGLDAEEAMYLLTRDLTLVEGQLRARLPWFDALTEVRQNVLIDMGFNLGVPGLLTFVRTLRLIEQGAYGEAGDAMLQSQWAGQVGARAERLARWMRSGRDDEAST
jgi:lysozyme